MVIHYAGDAILAEFAAVSDALICAGTVQQKLAEKNESLGDDRKIQFRIGVNLGEVIVDRDDIYGDGVNIAARLESLAKPGEICISGTVYDALSKSVRDELGDKANLEFEPLGVQCLKNIQEPIVVYRLAPGTTETGAAAHPRPEAPR